MHEDGKYSHFFRLNGEEIRNRKRDRFFKHYKEEKKEKNFTRRKKEGIARKSTTNEL